MKRRGDHDTSAEGRPGENRGEAGTYGAEHHRPPDEIPHRERTDCSRQFRGVRGEIRDDHISDVSGRDSPSKGMLIIPPGFYIRGGVGGGRPYGLLSGRTTTDGNIDLKKEGGSDALQKERTP